MSERCRARTVRPWCHLQELYFAEQRALNVFHVEFLLWMVGFPSQSPTQMHEVIQSAVPRPSSFDKGDITLLFIKRPSEPQRLEYVQSS